MTTTRAEARAEPTADAARAEVLEGARLHLSAGADADALYARWFHGAVMPQPVQYPSPAAYTAACLDPARFEAGWTVLVTDAGAPGALVVGRSRPGQGADDLRQVPPPWYVPDTGAAPAPVPGDPVRVHPGTTEVGGGFWHVWSDRWRRDGAPARLRRLYLVAAAGAETSVARAVVAAGPTADRWYVKCATGPHGHTRRDVAVLYLPAEDGLPGWVHDVLRGTTPLRRDDAPPLTVPVGPGAGLAPDPGDGTSFGQAVCGRLADLAASAPTTLQHPDRWRTAAGSALALLLPDGDTP